MASNTVLLELWLWQTNRIKIIATMTRTKRRRETSNIPARLRAVVVFLFVAYFSIAIISKDEGTVLEENGNVKRPSSRKLRTDRKAIVTTVQNSKSDLEDLCRALRSLKRLSDRDSTPVVVFSETPLDDKFRTYLRQCTERRLDFPTDSSGQKLFWISQVFTLRSLSSYDTIMRLESKSCWKEDSDLLYLPGLPNTTVDYHAGINIKFNQDTCGSLVDFAKHYIVENHVIVQNPQLWYEIDEKWRQERKCIAYQTHFEVIRLDLMRQETVQLWLQAAIEQDPKWNEQLLRSFTVAMFASSVIPPSKTSPTGYSFSLGTRRPAATCRSLPAPRLEM
jgi:hypothetical protein